MEDSRGFKVNPLVASIAARVARSSEDTLAWEFRRAIRLIWVANTPGYKQRLLDRTGLILSIWQLGEIGMVPSDLIEEAVQKTREYADFLGMV